MKLKLSNQERMVALLVKKGWRFETWRCEPAAVEGKTSLDEIAKSAELSRSLDLFGRELCEVLPDGSVQGAIQLEGAI